MGIHNLQIGDSITSGVGNDVYYVTQLPDDVTVSMICVTPTSNEFAKRFKRHIIELASGYKKVCYLGDILNEMKAMKLVGLQLWRPVFFSCGSVHDLEKMVIQRGLYEYNKKVSLVVPGMQGDAVLTVNELFTDKLESGSVDGVFGYWVDKNGYRPSDYSYTAVTCDIHEDLIKDFEVATVNMMVRKATSTDGTLKKIRMCTPTGVMLADETFIPNAKISEYITSNGKRLTRLPLYKGPVNKKGES